MIACLDSSVAVRLAFGVADRLREWRKVKRIVVSALVEVECFRVLDQERLRHGLSDGKIAAISENIRALIDRAEVVELGAAVLERAKQPFPTQLATLDALHVSTALLWKQWREPTLVFATHDHQQGAGARAVGLQVIGV
ncbi:MAG: PIN domain-containing protein [Deltaproteobacteria bacterium]|nr:PIN domain-containing protein [Deltaproteobacteria bacterium]